MNALSDHPKDKWGSLSASETVMLFLIAAIIIVGLCASVTLRKKRSRTDQLRERAEAEGSVSRMSGNETMEKQNEQQVSSDWSVMKRVLIGTLCWSKASKWIETESSGDWRGATEVVVEQSQSTGDGRHGTTVSPLWQRRILMGERCELPRYSGLILYDERGRPLSISSNKETPHQEKAAPVLTTLRDLL